MKIFLRNISVLFLSQGLSLTAMAGQPFMNDYLQSVPELKLPGVGSLQGSLARFNPGAIELAQGTLSLPLSLTVDESRGPLQIKPFPSYSSQQGLSEWGQGLETQLQIQRFRTSGDLNFIDDDFISPWGHLVRGADHAYYPKGMKSPVRVVVGADHAKAQLGDGSVWTFRRILPSSVPGVPFGFALTEVRSLIGDLTVLVWDESARPALKEVSYGSKSASTLPYFIRFNYENLPADNLSYSYRSKKLVQLTRRIQSVQFFDTSFSSVKARWSYGFIHEFSQYSPAFYLKSYQKTYADGATEPAIQLRYETFDGMIDSLASQKTERLAALLESIDIGGIRSGSLSFFDYDNDGLVDVEVASTHKLYRQTLDGFKEIADFEPQVDWQPCLPPENPNTPARRVLRLQGPNSHPLVFLNLPGKAIGTTRLLACELSGVPVYDQTLPYNFSQDPLVTIGDLNGDQKPDLVRYTPSSLEFLENVSTENTVKFQYRANQPLEAGSAESNIAVADLNGDGIPDIFMNEGSFARVLFGKGNFEFVKKPLTMAYLSPGGQPYTVGSDAAVSFVDANGDGLVDLAISRGREFFLLTNQGLKFKATPLPFTEGRENEGEALPLNILGNGSPMVFRSSGRKDIYAMELSRPGVGLLKSVDDGQGNQILLKFAWQNPLHAKFQLQKQLISLEIFHLGKGSSVRTWEYGASVMSAATPSLLGYESVREIAPLLATEITFQNTEEAPGLITGIMARDLTGSGLEKHQSVRFEPAFVRGIRTWQKSEERNFHRSTGGDALPFIESYEYDDNSICLKSTTGRLGADTLETQRSYHSLDRMDTGLACPLQSIERKGQHARKDFDFKETIQVVLNDLAQPVAVKQVNGETTRILQEISYDDLHRLSQLKELSGLIHSYAYEGDSSIIASYATSIGVRHEVPSRYPNGLMKEHRTDRGNEVYYEQSFVYDSYERLKERWDNLTQQPLQTIDYIFGSLKTPAIIQQILNPADEVSMESSQYIAGDGDILAQVKNLQSGKVLDELHSFDVSKGMTALHSKMALDDDFSLDWSSYAARSGFVTQQFFDGHGKERISLKTHEKSIVESVIQKAFVLDQALIRQETSNQKFTKITRTDSLGRITGRRDEAGFWSNFQYDMANRLREVTLADGKKQGATYDNWGQVMSRNRSSLGSIDYRYNAKGLLEQKDFKNKDGVIYRSLNMSYDPYGRLSKKVATANGIDQAVSYFYDGFTATPEFFPGQRGFLTAIKGPHFATRFVYDPKGRLLRKVKTLDRSGIRKEAVQTYYGDDRLKTADIRVEVGGRVQLMSWEHRLRSDGLLGEIWLNGNLFASLDYDRLGLLKKASLDHGAWNLDFSYDPVTSNVAGYMATSQERSVSYELSKDNRGHIGREAFNGQSKVYTYDDRSYLATVESSLGNESFLYNAIGLLEAVPSAESGLSYDAGGRLQQKDGMTFAYDGQGQIASVRLRDGSIVSYGYDEDGLQNMRLKDGTLQSAQLSGTYISKDHILESMKIGETIVGYFDNGKFQPLLGDFRGSVFDNGRAANIPSAYGKRKASEIWQSIIDFAGHPRDIDTGLIRMGLRDYDAEQGKFVEPDPLFLESLERCVESPVECALMGYAGNDPIRFTDPTGLKYDMGRWVFENREQMEAAVKEANQKLIDAGYKDEDFTIIVTGGDRYKKGEQVYSSTDNTVIANSSPTSKHLEKRAFDFEVQGMERSEASRILSKVDNFKVDDRYESDNHIHITVKDLSQYDTKSDAKVDAKREIKSTANETFETIKAGYALDKIAIRKRCLQNNCSGK